MCREAWSAIFVIFGFVDFGVPDGYQQRTNRQLTWGEPSSPPSWPWRRTALLFAAAAQLITISALVGADPIAATWSSVLLAVAARAVGGRGSLRTGAR